MENEAGNLTWLSGKSLTFCKWDKNQASDDKDVTISGVVLNIITKEGVIFNGIKSLQIANIIVQYCQAIPCYWQ